LMIPGFVGNNIEGIIGRRGNTSTLWPELPSAVKRFGQTPEEIFVTFSTLKNRYGDRIEQMPLGAVALYTFVDKLKTGLTQFMAGARNFRLDAVNRNDLVALTKEAAEVSGLSYVMEASREEAYRILDS
jgi:hypothetical protein